MLRILLFLFLFITLVVSTIAGGGYWVYKNKLHMPIALSEDVHHMVEPNTTLRTVAINLMDKKLLNYPTALLWVNLARWQKKAHKIKAGEYLINVGITPQQLLDKMIAGKTVKYKLTIPEGWNFKQVLAAIRKHP
ncbi:endolytic transglycosylase MltG, partial [Candidatus Marithrix sp. Canyon 246]